jgi:hypothetical protein
MATRYTRPRLAEAVAGARTMSEVLARFGLEKDGGTRKYVRERIRAFGIDTSHLEREGGRWTREVLAEAVAASSNMNEVLLRLGVDIVGGQHTHISRRVRALGIDTSHFVRAGGGGARRQSPESLLVRQPPGPARRVRGDRLKRALLWSDVPECCEMCGLGAEWRGCELPLEVDHIDGDWRNNTMGNLRFLCPKCHATTDTYRGRGKRGKTTAAAGRTHGGATR